MASWWLVEDRSLVGKAVDTGGNSIHGKVYLELNTKSLTTGL